MPVFFICNVSVVAVVQTNNMRYPLYTLLAEDADGVGQPVAFALLAREDQTHVEHFLRYFAECNSLSNTQCVVVDKDLAEINAMKNCWQIPVLICYFHVLWAIDRHLAGTQMAAEDKELCCLVSALLRWINVHVGLFSITTPHVCQSSRYYGKPTLSGVLSLGPLYAIHLEGRCQFCYCI